MKKIKQYLNNLRTVGLKYTISYSYHSVEDAIEWRSTMVNL